MPIVIAGAMMLTSRMASDSPTASASILVATPRLRSTRQERGSRTALPSPRRPSQIMRPPMKARSPKATQWSTCEMTSLRAEPPSQPMTGMAA